jgi:hypothetical protein
LQQVHDDKLHSLNAELAGARALLDAARADADARVAAAHVRAAEQEKAASERLARVQAQYDMVEMQRNDARLRCEQLERERSSAVATRQLSPSTAQQSSAAASVHRNARGTGQLTLGGEHYWHVIRLFTPFSICCLSITRAAEHTALLAMAERTGLGGVGEREW